MTIQYLQMRLTFRAREQAIYLQIYGVMGLLLQAVLMQPMLRLLGERGTLAVGLAAWMVRSRARAQFSPPKPALRSHRHSTAVKTPAPSPLFDLTPALRILVAIRSPRSPPIAFLGVSSSKCCSCAARR